MKFTKSAVVVLVVAITTLSGCVVVPPRAYIATPGIYVQPAGYYGDGYGHHGRR